MVALGSTIGSSVEPPILSFQNLRRSFRGLAVCETVLRCDETLYNPQIGLLREPVSLGDLADPFVGTRMPWIRERSRDRRAALTIILADHTHF